ncbi:MAG: PEP-CTERM sorting domain-containing protein [Rhodanobacteraceae bacterium]
MTVGAALAMLGFAPYALANTVRINFSGAAGSGYADLTIASDANASSSYTPDPTPPNTSGELSPYDPAGASLITGASGTFDGIAITGILATSPGAPPPLVSDPSEYENLPASFSWTSSGADSYDDLFYFDANSPWVCPPGGAEPWTYHGGFLDIFGVVFSLADGNYVGLWSDGVVPPGYFGPGTGGLTFGLNVYGSDFSVLSGQFSGVTAAVPEPNFIWLFGAGVLGLFAWRRAADKRKQALRIR